MLAWWAWDYLTRGRVAYFYVQPRFHFTYWLFDWVRPLPGVGMYLLFLSLAILGLCIALGCFYRLASLLFAAGFTYVFLLDATNYQNHYYLIILLSWLLVILPLNRAVSLDAALWPRLRSSTAPGWALWLVRFHIALPYFFGGVAKLDADWLAGEPMRQMLAAQAALPVVGPWLASEWCVQLFVWGGLLLDLCIVPALLWKRTRWPAYGVCVLFHLLNSVLFQIHVFPWLMIFASTIFFPPDWPRRALGGLRLDLPGAVPIAWKSLPRQARLGLALLAAYGVFHVYWPLRHQVYPGPVSWNERGHYFAWRMMLRGKLAGVRYYLTDRQTGETWNPDLRPYLNTEQAGRFSRDPELILHLAHFLADQHRRETGRTAEVRALVLMSLNGRKPELFIDPSLDLASERRGFAHRPWVLPLTEPLGQQPWTAPLGQWERLVELPPLPVVTRAAGPQSSANHPFENVAQHRSESP